MSFTSAIPNWYWAIALIVSLYHAYRGGRWQWLIGKQKQPFEMSKTDIVILRCVEDGFFYFICSISGFLSLRASIHFFDGLLIQHKAGDAGTSVLAAFLFLVGIVGVSGQLSYLTQLGKIPGIK
jgi:hypothetical protein